MAEAPGLEALRARAGRVLMRARDAGLTIATVESCTGGLLASLFTDIPGASSVFRGGWVPYHDDVKRGALGVTAEMLDVHGAVSEVVARALAEGAFSRSGADLAVATTGILGPGGETEGKPVGSVWLAIATRTGARARRFRGHGDRLENKRAFVDAALAFVEDVLVQDNA